MNAERLVIEWIVILLIIVTATVVYVDVFMERLLQHVSVYGLGRWLCSLG